ncbi:MAG: acyl-CoA dehydrogenase family protein [Chloroflexota bacterium]
MGWPCAAYEEAIKYAKEREAFGQPIADFQAIQWMLKPRMPPPKLRRPA